MKDFLCICMYALDRSVYLLQEGREVQKKKAFTPPPRFMNIEEARYSQYYYERNRSSV